MDMCLSVLRDIKLRYPDINDGELCEFLAIHLREAPDALNMLVQDVITVFNRMGLTPTESRTSYSRAA
jgi:hypothetical protein